MLPRVIRETDVEVFRSLMKRWPGFFWDFGNHVVVGEKIAEGSQAEIFNAELTFKYGRKWEGVVKVLTDGFSLKYLQKQWPLRMLHNHRIGGLYRTVNSCAIYGATLFTNGRFAFRMRKYWGDLQKLIDVRMQLNHNQCPPFSYSEVGHIVIQIARGMEALHKRNIIHRDVKASNVLIRILQDETFDPVYGKVVCDVADFESSVGIIGRVLESFRGFTSCTKS